MNKTYYIPSNKDGFSLAALGEFCTCKKCGRKIIVEMGLIGTTHHFGLTVTCADCMEICDEFKTNHPDVVQRIEDWKAGKELGPQYIFKRDEEAIDCLEHTSVRPGAVTGVVHLDNKPFKTFYVDNDGKFHFFGFLGSSDIGSGTLNFNTGVIDIKWTPQREYKLIFNYQYEV